MLASDPFASINGDSVICINVTQTHSYMLEVGIPSCKHVLRPSSKIMDPSLENKSKRAVLRSGTSCPGSWSRSMREKREGETDENGRDPVQVP